MEKIATAAGMDERERREEAPLHALPDDRQILPLRAREKIDGIAKQMANPYVASILESLHEGVLILDRNRRIAYWNRGAERITGYAAEKVLGRFCHNNLLMHRDEQGENLCQGMCPAARTMEDGLQRDVWVFLRHSRGHMVPVAVRIRPIRDDKGDITGVVEAFSDLTPIYRCQDRLDETEKVSLLDPLTKLPNRRFLERELEGLINEFQRDGHSFGVLFLDVDGFKGINDGYGHSVGDQILVAAAKTFLNISRPYDVVGRLGGDEFLVLVRDVNRRNLEVLGERYRTIIASSGIPGNGSDIFITISVGGALAGEMDSPEQIVARADRMLYQSKRAGKNRVSIS